MIIVILGIGVIIGLLLARDISKLYYYNKGYREAKKHYITSWTKLLESANHDIFEGWKAEVKTSVVEGRYPRETMIQLVIFSQDRRNN